MLRPPGHRIPVIARKPRAPALAWLLAAFAPVAAAAQPSEEPDFPTWVEEHVHVAGDLYEKGYTETTRYGNWVGEGWWGGSTSPLAPGWNPPVDDLDRVAQRHDFGYQLAEELGKGRPGVKGTYMLMADIIAMRDALALDRDPAKWGHPPKDVEKAKSYVKRLVIIFQEYQTRRNALKSMEIGRDDFTDLETLDNMLDGLPDQAEFERMQSQRIRKWDADYKAHLAATAPAPAPAPTTPAPVATPAPAKPKPAPALPASSDCSQGSFLDQTLCKHNVGNP